MDREKKIIGAGNYHFTALCYDFNWAQLLGASGSCWSTYEGWAMQWYWWEDRAWGCSLQLTVKLPSAEEHMRRAWGTREHWILPVPCFFTSTLRIPLTSRYLPGKQIIGNLLMEFEGLHFTMNMEKPCYLYCYLLVCGHNPVLYKIEYDWGS